MPVQGPIPTIGLIHRQKLYRGELVRILLRHDHRVAIEAGDGQEYLQQREQLDPKQFPGIVLVDLDPPDSDELSVLNKIKIRENEPRIILLSGRRDEDSILQAVRLGADGYLNSDCKEEEVIRVINSVLTDGYWLPAWIVCLLIRNERTKTDGYPAKRSEPGDISRYVSQAIDADVFGLKEKEDEPEPSPRRAASSKGKRAELTPRETQILGMIGSGLPYVEISDILDISQRTVQTVRDKLCVKLGVASTAGLVRYAIQNDIEPYRPRSAEE